MGRCSFLEKKDQYSCNINVGSNHLNKVFKQIPNSIMIKLSTNSSNEDIFTQNKQDYDIALKIVDIKINSYVKVEKTIKIYRIRGGYPRGVMVKAKDCGIVVRDFVLHSCYHVHFRANTLGKVMNHPLSSRLWVK